MINTITGIFHIGPILLSPNTPEYEFAVSEEFVAWEKVADHEYVRPSIEFEQHMWTLRVRFTEGGLRVIGMALSDQKKLPISEILNNPELVRSDRHFYNATLLNNIGPSRNYRWGWIMIGTSRTTNRPEIHIFYSHKRPTFL